MNTSTTHTSNTAQSAAMSSALPASAGIVFRMLHQLQHGSLDLHLPDGSQAHFGVRNSSEPQAVLHLRDWSVLRNTLKSGDIGFAEGFIAGHWSSPDLPALLRLFMRNREAVESAIYGSWWGALWYRIKHLLNRNSRQGSKKNIHAHYDLGNAFYGLWLDPSMNYSSAWFGGDFSQSTAHAQQAKMRRALNECGVSAGQRVLEIGCGWGALAELAGQQFGARVTGVTLSQEQLNYAQLRLAQQQIAGDLRFQDYRDINDGPFDAVVSIEMFEAVGRAYWPSFFETIKRQLKPGGKACIQTITIRDDLFARYVKSTDFIQQYIFPGGLLPSPSAFRLAALQAGLRVVRELSFGPDYAETLRRWRGQFLAQEASVLALGFDARFMRIWEFYLAYCEAAFDTENTGVMQFTLQKD
jgi:cyclopropane-fatty-acyl-phospholipid synthase